MQYTIKNKLLAITLIILLMVGHLSPVLVYAAPEAPSAPSAPEAPSIPSAPSTPSAPSAPEAPSAPQTPTYNPDDNDEPEENVDNNDDNNTDSNNDDEEDGNEQVVEEEQAKTANSESNNSAETGNNEVGYTSIDTGDATSQGTLANNVNNNTALNGTGAGAPGASVTTSGNGADSNNSGSATVENNTSTVQDNSASVGNGMEQSAISGSNTASENVGNSSINTGDANVTGTIWNDINTNIAGLMVSEFNVVDNHIGDLVLDFDANCIVGCAGGANSVVNSGNGSESTNNGSVDTTNNTETFQTNDAELENNMVLLADSGSNEANKNTGGDTTITTGDANVAANVMNFVNNNIAGNVILGVVNVFGNLVGDIILPENPFTCASCVANALVKNTGNGSDSTNNSNVTATTNDETYQFNTVDIENNLLLDAQTGENTTSQNTGGTSSVTTGDSTVQANTLNIANTNLDGQNWWLVLVNRAGQWIGQIVGAPQGSMFAGSDGTEFAVDEYGQITAVNSGNGSGSDNTSTVNQENNNVLVQDNNAKIVNNLDLRSNTGENDASKNTGGNSSIDTGDASIIANLINFVNNNISGGNLMVTFVNVFGNWNGNLITPGQKKLASESNNSNPHNNIGGQNTTNENSNNNSNKSNTATVAGAQSEKTQSPKVLGITNNSSQKGSSKLVATTNSSDTTNNIGNNTESVATIQPQDSSAVTINLAWALLIVPLLGIAGIAYFISRKITFVKKALHVQTT